MLILLHGPDTFRSRQYLKEMMAEFKAKRDPSGMNVAVFDAEKIEGGAMLEAALAAPFLAERRLTVIEKLSAPRQQGVWEIFLELVKNKKISESSVVVVWEGELKKNLHPLFEVLAKQEYSREFKKLTKTELEKWLIEKFSRNGLKAEKAALGILVNYPWADLWQLNNETDKIAAYLAKENEPLAAKDLALFLPESLDENVFHFIDALVGRQAKEATKLLQGLWLAGEEEGNIFSKVIWQFRNLLTIKDYLNLNPGAVSDKVAGVLGLHPFVVKKSLAILAGFSFEKLKEIYQELLEMDIKVKKGEGELKKLLEFFVAKVGT